MSTTKITSTQPAPTDFFQKPQGKGFTIDFEQQVSPPSEFPPASSPRGLGSGRSLQGLVY